MDCMTLMNTLMSEALGIMVNLVLENLDVLYQSTLQLIERLRTNGSMDTADKIQSY